LEAALAQVGPHLRPPIMTVHADTQKVNISVFGFAMRNLAAGAADRISGQCGTRRFR